jgi:Tfp pilus assembly protein PilN
LITKQQAERVLEILPQVTDMEAEMAETIVLLYEQLDELDSDIAEIDEVLEKAIRDHCGCLGGLQAP